MITVDNDTIEAMIDAESLGEFLGRVAAIAGEKAEHIRSNWGDKRLAQDWDTAADTLSTLAEACEL